MRNVLPLKVSKKFPPKNIEGIGYVWACGIRNGDGGGRIVPLKPRIGLPVMTPFFDPTELGSIGMGAESSPFPLASNQC